MLLAPRSPNHRVTPDDHSAWILMPTLLALSYAFSFLGLRLIVKWRRYSVDDAVLGAAYVAALMHWITILEALHLGLGKSSLLTTSGEKPVAQYTFAGRIFLLITLCLSKLSITLLARSIFAGPDVKAARRACNVALSVLAALGLVAVLVGSAGCSYKSILAADPNLHCSHQDVRWKVIVALDALTEVAIVLMVIGLLIPIQMQRRHKAIVVVAFASRLPQLIFSIAFLRSKLSQLDRTRSFRDGLPNDANPSLSIAIPSAWFESMLGYSLISATMPCLPNIMRRFRTGGLAFTWHQQ